jgi:alpha-1,6-mannosyltransferase
MTTPRPSPFAAFFKWANLLLIISGCAALVLYRISLRAHTGPDILWFLKIALVQCLLYVFMAWLVMRARTARSTLIIVIAFAALFRLSLLFSPPYLSDDIYRYVWDGRVQAAGINPYRYIPADAALAQLRDDQIYPRINRKDYARTIYPPAAEAVFFLTTRISESVTWMKATMVLFEALAMWALAQLLASFGLPRQRVLLYAWHPLVVWEFAGSGHADSIAIAFIALALLARRRKSEIGTGISLAGAALGKVFPFVLFPAFYKRWDWKMPLAFLTTIVVGYLPYLGVGLTRALVFLFGDAPERGIEGGKDFFLLTAVRRLPLGFHMPTAAFVIVAVLIGAVLSIWMIARRNEHYIANALIIGSVFVVLASPHFPWYFAWLVPFLCLIPDPAVIYLTLASFLMYLTWLGDAPNQVLKMKAGIYVPTLVLCALMVWWRRRKRTSVDYVDYAEGETAPHIGP